MNVFEVTIRVLGGLLSGHMLAIDKELNLLDGMSTELFSFFFFVYVAISGKILNGRLTTCRQLL